MCTGSLVHSPTKPSKPPRPLESMVLLQSSSWSGAPQPLPKYQLYLHFLYTVIIFPEISPFGFMCGPLGFMKRTCLVYICALVSLCQIDTGKCTHILLSHHLINTIYNSNMLQPVKGHLEGVQLIHSSSVGQQSESPVVKFWKPNETH
jgi:hypothetical protein